MRNQIEAAERLGLRCETINSASATTVTELEDALRRDEVDLLLISPERLANPDFGNTIMPIVGSRPGLIVIDEVHCISDWGHDFRPDYRRIGRIVDRLVGASVPILGCTATANDRVVKDVADQLGAQLTTFRGPLHREGLALSAIRLDRQAERLAWLAETIPGLDGSGIVYCLTVRDVENVAAWLDRRGIAVEPYFGSLDNELRLAAESKLQNNQIKALVATTALGMGYDKPDLSFVIHFQSPGSPVAYYQQVGRAGRALDSSRGILLRGLEDEQIQDYFIESSFADEETVRRGRRRVRRASTGRRRSSGSRAASTSNRRFSSSSSSSSTSTACSSESAERPTSERSSPSSIPGAGSNRSRPPGAWSSDRWRSTSTPLSAGCATSRRFSTTHPPVAAAFATTASERGPRLSISRWNSLPRPNGSSCPDRSNS